MNFMADRAADLLPLSKAHCRIKLQCAFCCHCSKGLNPILLHQ